MTGVNAAHDICNNAQQQEPISTLDLYKKPLVLGWSMEKENDCMYSRVFCIKHAHSGSKASWKRKTRVIGLYVL
jgi:hypothetical protein